MNKLQKVYHFLKTIPLPVYLCTLPLVVSIFLLLFMNSIYYTFDPPAIFDEPAANTASTQLLAYKVNVAVWTIYLANTILILPGFFLAGLIIVFLRIIKSMQQRKSKAAHVSHQT